MTCISCEQRIERKLSKTNGIKKAKVSYVSSQVECSLDAQVISKKQICEIIEALGYTVIAEEDASGKQDKVIKVLGIALSILALYQVMKYFGLTNLFYMFPEAQESMGYSLLFMLGMLTSVHCIAMCGGINLSQCIGQPVREEQIETKRFWSTVRPSLLYNLGRVISYTVIGGVVGAMGSVVSFSGRSKGFVQLIAGIFMIIMGINMLGIFPGLRRFNLRMPRIFRSKLRGIKKGNSPFYIGLINGLMPCGPLQAMQLYSLSAGSFLKGALAMFLFSLGTVPLMFGLGALSSILSKTFTEKIMSIGAVLVVILGISMLTSGLSLAGINVAASINQNESARVRIENGIQIVENYLEPGQYSNIEVQAGMPVKWVIHVEKGSLNGCNNRIFIPYFEIEKKFELGKNTIEFMPTEEGAFSYSCWMGMIRGSITVKAPAK
ncbi:MAG: sulfite exporter TauE/SafE family protein [Candidatus Cellulosilyticum pullistercoris]|uniref:Sulfite exporter TauE/SafE family protein n=1 Tax=Candidatus Cellulosilyticum pullistercoris TaxID=2838521 RepID=A0A9E2KEF1_9FIRM|nr:sulfite exporter TauE/SafE family protein [Candidatus Cellulosilyticum pullistercoris]